jgi:multiple antibiotic resistance protein
MLDGTMLDSMPMSLKTLETFVVSIISLYIVINPATVAAVFLGLSRQLPTDERRRIALRATITAVAILTFFALGGTFILAKLRITGAALQIAGGVFIFALAFALARGKEREFFGQSLDAVGGGSAKSLAYSPMAVPIMAGPASITVVMTAATKAADDPYAWASLLIAIGVTCLLCFFSMLRWIRLAERRGPGFGVVLPKVMGLVLAVIAVQFIIDGIQEVILHVAELVRDRLSGAG